MKLKKLQIRNDIAFLLEFAIDDFKGKYAGSVGGVVWAIIQPISTIILYWFVFQLGFKSQPVIGIPFILWLISGLLPWLFLSDTIANATSSLVDYSYLVKKIKFNIYILPLVKIVSGLFVHFVLLGFVIGMFALYGRSVDIYYLQIPYYLLFTVVILSGVCYLTSTLFVFFRDTIQVVSILLQIIFWTTPIVWSLDIMNTEIQNMFDLKLYSNAQNKYIKKLDNGTFEVRIPINNELKNKELVVYYVDENNNKQVYDVTIKDGYAIFNTNHFSIYTLAEKSSSTETKTPSITKEEKKEDIKNPATSDNITYYVILTAISILGIVLSKKLLKNN